MWNKIILPIAQYIREALSENDKGSYSRLSGLIAVVSSVGWVTYVVIKTKALPDFGGVTVFITGANAAYAANQAKHVVSVMKGSVQNPDPQVGQNG